MSQLTLYERAAAPGTPSAGALVLYGLASNSALHWKDDAGVQHAVGDVLNNTAQTVGFGIVSAAEFHLRQTPGVDAKQTVIQNSSTGIAQMLSYGAATGAANRGLIRFYQVDSVAGNLITSLDFDVDGKATFVTTADLLGNLLRIRTSKTPASASAAGNQGEFCWDGGFLYMCTATNNWRRVATATF